MKTHKCPYTFNCSYGCSDEAVYDDIASLVSLTGYESQAEMEKLHQDLFHWHDEYEENEIFDRKYDTPTAKVLAIDAKEKRKQHQRCSICPPNKGENASRKAKYGNKKPKYKDHNRK